MELAIVFERGGLVAVNKPSGLAVHRGWSRDRVTAMSLLRDQLGHHVHPVHRLDRATSGALLFARDKDVLRLASEQFAKGAVYKRYFALVRGIPEPEGVIDYPLARDRESPSQPAITRYRHLASFERYALVSVVPQTGRAHQIRRHFKHIFHPLVGDVRYGDGRVNRDVRARFSLHRLALHASTLRIELPGSGEVVEIFAPLAEDLRRPFSAMGFAVPS